MAALVPPTNFFRIMPGQWRKVPSAWHVLVKVSHQDVDEDHQAGLGWPAVITTYHAACGAYSQSLYQPHEFRPVGDVPYKQICKACWPYMVTK